MSHRRVLFVDDNPEFLASIRELMLALSEGTWDVLTAEGAGAALGLLQQQPIDLIVVDVEMPVVDGVQFLQLLQRKYPAIPRTALTGGATEARRAAVLSAGAEFCLEKPRAPGQSKQLYAALNELAHPPTEDGFRGVLRRVGLADVVQMECLAANSSVLEITAPSARGEIVIKGGAVLHAWSGPLRGEEAFYQLLALRGGQFALRPFVAPAERTIDGSWEFLLMEAARQQDEARHGGAPPEEEPPPPPKTEEPHAPMEAPSLTSYLPRETKTPAAEALPPATRIDEVLLCSQQGDVLYEWQCPQSNARINLLEFISQKAWQLAGSLPIGRLERLEVQGPAWRVVTQLQDDRSLFVRSSQPPAA
ncbi:MAG: response regulator [Verrucomicrobia bacterium]|nr:response regulator [Verrucomicrobiota bacterium]